MNLKALNYLCKINALIAQLESFKAANQLSLLRNEHPSYGESSFSDIEYELNKLSSEIMEDPDFNSDISTK